jgi:PAS domain S-box-containing protein
MDLFDLLVQQNPDGVLAFDRELRYTVWNPGMERISGFMRDQVLGQHAFELFPFLREIGEDRCFEAVLRGETAVSRNQRYRIVQTGRTGYFEAHYIPIRDTSGAVTGGLGLIRNVTARHDAEALARESRDLFESFMAFIPGVAFVKDSDGRHVYSNRLFEQTHGLPPAGAIGKLDADIFPPATAARFRQHDLEVLSKGQPIRSVDEQGARNEPEHWMWVKFPITDARGRQLVAGVAFNITEQYQAEQALRASEERYRHLSKALEEMNRRKDEFLATLGHELRNPLAPLLTAAELLQLEPPGNELTQQAVDVISRQAEHMRRLIDDLLDVARITRGIVSLQLQELDLRDALQEVLRTAQSWLDSREHQLVVSIPARPVYVEADRMRLEQVITNLVSNAAKFTPVRGRIEVTLERDEETAVIRVADNGKGIPSDMLAGVFDLFTQVNPSIDRAEGGLGLGLTLVKRLTEMHGGSVEASSAGEGKGTQFTVRLPIRQSRGAHVHSVADRIVRRRTSTECRVLIVDDNSDCVAMLNLLLPGWGYRTAVAHSGTEALARAKAFKPHVILLDIGLPEMSGYEVAERIRQDPSLAGTALVALTGYGQEEDRRRTREAGFAAHLTKPVDAETLNKMLTAIGDRSDT